MAMTGLGNRGLRHDINITPYIDVLLVLLIIFMITAPMRKYDMQVRVPQPPPPPQQNMSKPDSIIVEMDLDHSNRSVKMEVEEDRARIPLHYSRKNFFYQRKINLLSS